MNVIKLLMKVLVPLETKQSSHKQTIIVKFASQLRELLKNYKYFLNFHPGKIVKYILVFYHQFARMKSSRGTQTWYILVNDQDIVILINR